MSSFFRSSFRLPAPLPFRPLSITPIAHPQGDLEFSAPTDGRGMASLIHVTFRPRAPDCLWARTRDGNPVPWFRIDDRLIHPASEVAAAAVAVLQFLTLEAGRPDVATDFSARLRELHESSVGTDSAGVTLTDLAGEFRDGFPGAVIVSGEEAALGHDLTRTALLPHLGHPSAHWRLWCDAYYALLSREVSHGDPDRNAREALITLQVSIESACLAECDWRQTDQYNYEETITQFPDELHGPLASLLLTRNSFVHRGRLELWRMRPRETYTEARNRAEADGPLLPSHLREFAEAVASALDELERGRRVNPKRRRPRK